MIVITLTKCPLALRGDLTKWLQEINTGVYIGNVSARVREKLWDRICREVKGGSATMVYSAQNEQHLDFRVHNTIWAPIDYDGIKLMMRPNLKYAQKLHMTSANYSKASKYAKCNKIALSKNRSRRGAYVVVDLETTGLHSTQDEIIEFAALKVIDGQEVDVLDEFVSTTHPLTQAISNLTGITNEKLKKQGVKLPKALETFQDFIEELPIVSHNNEFDASFLQAACNICNQDYLENQWIDTLSISKSKLNGLSNYKLKTIADFLNIQFSNPHHALDDCRATNEIFLKLIEN